MKTFKTFFEKVERGDGPLTLGQISSSHSAGIKELKKFGSKPIAVIGSGRHEYLIGTLSEYDKKEYKGMKKPAGTEIYRYATPQSVKSGQIPIVAVNMDKGFLYFMTPESSDTDKPEFGTKVDFRAKYVRDLSEECTQISDIEEAYTANLSHDEYQKLRKASMYGNFPHKFTAKTNGDVTFSSNVPNKLADDLEKIISSRDSSWKEILGIGPVKHKSNKIPRRRTAGGNAKMDFRPRTEEAANTTTSVGVAASDVSNIGRKRQHKVLTRKYIEVMGKRKKLYKEDVETKHGTVKVTKRNTKKRGEDPYQMTLHKKDGSTVNLGSHPNPTEKNIHSIVNNHLS
jgi:hypothetical protein